MFRKNASVAHPTAPRAGKKYFTLAEALRALPLVRRVVRDLQGVQEKRLALHSQMTRSSTLPDVIKRLQSDFDRQTQRLEEYIEELCQIGVELKDPGRGLLDFPAIHEEREILLCWKAGEETITHWHEIDVGFAGRRPISELS